MDRYLRLLAAACAGLALTATSTPANAQTVTSFEAEDVQLTETGCVFQHVRTVIAFDEVVTWDARITVTDPDGTLVHSLDLVEETGTGQDATYEMVYCAASEPGTYTIAGEVTTTTTTSATTRPRAAAAAVQSWTDTFQVLGATPAPTPTPTLTPTTTSSATAPSRMGAPRCTARRRAVVVRWKAPTSSSPVTGYLVDISKGRTRTVTTTGRRVKVRHLSPGRYRIRVAARNAAGLSPYSRWVAVRVS
ncbi:fibronectin type III domain-containing protein [Nocardioides sp.]|uniref:fibronectin type III domain-containing protein n=1 Tax=Nocardioides sp. TaxID=35761 RepID=UPI0035AE3FB4